MTILERLLRWLLGRYEAAALTGDLEEEAHAKGLSRTWITLQLVRHVVTALVNEARLLPLRMRTALTVAIRDAVRTIRRHPGSTTLAFGIVGLSIAAATLTFSIVDTVVLRRLPFPEEKRIVAIGIGSPRNPGGLQVSPVDYYAWRDGSRSFDALAAWTWRPAAADLGGGAEAVRVAQTTANLFGVLRVTPILGSTFDERHELPGDDNVVIISHRLWQRRLAGDPTVIGRSVSIEGHRATVLGVMPSGFGFPVLHDEPIDMWRPLVIPAQHRVYTPASGRSSYLQVVGRLADTVSIEHARADIERVTNRLAAEFPIFYVDARVRISFLRETLTAPFRSWMILALGAVGLLVLLACTNVANLTLARLERQSRDLAVRASLGASRTQLVLLQLVEGLLLSFAAAACGLWAAYLGLEFIRMRLPEGIPRAQEIAIDARVLAAASLAAITTGVVMGLIPAWRASRPNVVDVVKGTAAGGSGSRRWQERLLVGEAALVSALLVVSTFVVGSLVRVLNTDLGFDHRSLVSARIAPAYPGLPPQEQQVRNAELTSRAAEALRALPWVTGVAAIGGGSSPLGSGSATAFISRDSERVPVELRSVSPGYFGTAGIALLRGREFGEVDGADSQRVVIIDASAGQQLFPNQEPVGRTVRFAGGGASAMVVGVVGHVRIRGPEAAAPAQLYHPLSQRPVAAEIIVRTELPPARAVSDIGTVLSRMMPAGSASPDVISMDDRFRNLTALRRFNASVLGTFGTLALVIGAAGIYGVTASFVIHQTRHIGIRIVLGASGRRVVTTIAVRSLRLLLTGAGVGLSAAWLASGWFRSLLFEVEPTDSVPYLLALALLLMGGLGAALLPAVRASRIDVLSVLRRE